MIAQTDTFHRIYFQMVFSEVFYDILAGLFAGYGAGEARFSEPAPGIYGSLGSTPISVDGQLAELVWVPAPDVGAFVFP